MQKQKKKIPLYGIRIGVDGDIRRIPIEIEKKWQTIQGVVGAITTEQHLAGGHNGVNRIAICDRYASSVKGINSIASRLCGKTVYGNVVLLKENSLGFPSLMSEGAAYKMQREVENGW